LLRSGGGGSALQPWDLELARSGAELSAMRSRYVDTLAPIERALLGELLPELGEARLALDGGWTDEAEALAQLGASRDEDTRRGFTTRGPHRADWSLAFEKAPKREHLSRGQEKLCALGCILGQARVFADGHGEWPIVCIDDLASELDGPHQEKLVRALLDTDAQILVTGTHQPEALGAVGVAAARFHVEPGRVTRLL
jgi:DNA replication and repair protein RecF